MKYPAGIAIAALLIAPFCHEVSGQIEGTGHDFSGKSWNTSTSGCPVCHTVQDDSTDDSFVWSHQMTDAVFSVYQSPRMNATVGAPTRVSRMCLSCHDGTVAIDDFGDNNGSLVITGRSNLGTDLRNDHPVSFLYDQALAQADGHLRNPDLTLTGLGGTIASDLLLDGKMECVSCHNPHSNVYGSFLIMDNSGDRLCVTCHDK